MCILMYFPPGAQPIREHLEQGCRSNPDGFGWAVVDWQNAEIITGKSMDAATAVEEFMALRKLYPADCAIFHARITTHGLTDLDNCHPFTVLNRPKSAGGDMILAHNGIISRCAVGLPGDTRSDTRRFAEDVLMRSFPALDSPKTRRRLEEYIGAGSKVVILTTDPAYKAQGYIFNERLGDWLEDADNIPGNPSVWYSNSSWCRTRYATIGYLSDDSWGGYGLGNGLGTGWPRTIGSAAKASRHWSEYFDDRMTEADGAYNGYVVACQECGYRLKYCACTGAIKTMYVPEGQAKTRTTATPDECKACFSSDHMDDDGYCGWCGSVICCGQDARECNCTAEAYIDAVDALLIYRDKPLGAATPMALTSGPATPQVTDDDAPPSVS